MTHCRDGLKVASTVSVLGKGERQEHLQTPKAFIATHLGSPRQRIDFPNMQRGNR